MTKRKLRKLREAETVHYGQNSTALEAYNTVQNHFTWSILRFSIAN